MLPTCIDERLCYVVERLTIVGERLFYVDERLTIADERHLNPIIL